MMTRTILLLCTILLTGMIPNASAVKHVPEQDVVDRDTEQPKYEPGKIVVKFRPLTEGITNLKGAARTGIESVDKQLDRFQVSAIEKRFRHRPIPQGSHLPDLSRILTLTFPQTFDPRLVARECARDPHIEYAEPMYLYTIEGVPNDSLYAQQYYLPQISAPQAWDLQHGDSNVVIAIVDNGIDLEHPDLFDNIWTNEAEAGGIEGVDDDGNGWVDDVHGYDLAEDDPDPTHCPPDYQDYFVHGTSTAGLAAAMTNNITGIAGISWNCEVMPVKTSRDNYPKYVPFGLDGIVYAAENGADIINLSWGRFGDYSQEEQDVIDYAYGSGCILVAGGGNMLTNDLHYPSSYTKVISVGWVDSSDVKDRSAAWGMAIDVCAPGVDMLSTIPRLEDPPHPYGYQSGGSVASAIVAGLCGLVKSRHPHWSNNQITRQVVLTADNIDHLNPKYAAALGSGRINAYQAMTETEPEEARPRIGVVKSVPDDEAGGDGDGFFEPGETIHVTAMLQNFSLRDVDTPVMISLSTPDHDLVIVNGSTQIAFFPSDTVITTMHPLVFSIAPDVTSHLAELHLNITYSGIGGFDMLPVFVGHLKESTLSVHDGRGFPGSKDNLVTIDLYNEKRLDTVWFDLLFNPNILSVSEVRQAGRAYSITHFHWSAFSGGVYVGLHGHMGQYLYPGAGLIIEILFDVAESAPPGVYECTLSDFFAGMQPGDQNTQPLNGHFIVALQGDVNNDSQVNILDAVLTVNIALGIHQPTPDELSAADCNTDSEVNILDVLCVVNRILGG